MDCETAVMELALLPKGTERPANWSGRRLSRSVCGTRERAGGARSACLRIFCCAAGRTYSNFAQWVQREGGGRLVAPRDDRVATDRPRQGRVGLSRADAARTCSESLASVVSKQASVHAGASGYGGEVVSMRAIAGIEGTGRGPERAEENSVYR